MSHHVVPQRHARGRSRLAPIGISLISGMALVAGFTVTSGALSFAVAGPAGAATAHTANPHVAMSISDPDNPYRYLEVRGVVEEIVPDPTGAFYMHLNDRYSGPLTEPPPDKADRVILVVRPTGYTKQ